jgi:hypothetical protein
MGQPNVSFQIRKEPRIFRFGEVGAIGAAPYVSGSKIIEGLVASNGQHPWAGRAFSRIEQAGAQPHAQEGFLSEILRDRFVFDDSDQERVDTAAISVVEFGERSGIPLPEALDDCGIPAVHVRDVGLWREHRMG